MLYLWATPDKHSLLSLLHPRIYICCSVSFSGKKFILISSSLRSGSVILSVIWAAWLFLPTKWNCIEPLNWQRRYVQLPFLNQGNRSVCCNPHSCSLKCYPAGAIIVQWQSIAIAMAKIVSNLSCIILLASSIICLCAVCIFQCTWGLPAQALFVVKCHSLITNQSAPARKSIPSPQCPSFLALIEREFLAPRKRLLSAMARCSSINCQVQSTLLIVSHSAVHRMVNKSRASVLLLSSHKVPSLW